MRSTINYSFSSCIFLKLCYITNMTAYNAYISLMGEYYDMVSKGHGKCDVAKAILARAKAIYRELSDEQAFEADEKVNMLIAWFGL